MKIGQTLAVAIVLFSAGNKYSHPMFGTFLPTDKHHTNNPGNTNNLNTSNTSNTSNNAFNLLPQIAFCNRLSAVGVG